MDVSQKHAVKKKEFAYWLGLHAVKDLIIYHNNLKTNDFKRK